MNVKRQKDVTFSFPRHPNFSKTCMNVLSNLIKIQNNTKEKIIFD